MRWQGRWRTAGAALAAVGVLAACGTASEDESSGAQTDTATDTEATDDGAEDTGAEGGGDDGGDLAAGEEFFAGETVTLVVPYSPGGGYDSYARMIAPYLQEELGASNVVVENEPGAGGLLAINGIVNDDSDGLRIAIMNAIGVAGATIAGAEGADFELDDLAYIGRVGQEPHLWVTGADSEWDSVDQVIEEARFTFGSTGPGAADFVLSSLLIDIFNLDGAEIVTGFEGSSENELAVTRGDVDGMTGDFDSRYPAVEDGDHRPLLVVGPERRDETPDTPAIVELDLDEEQQSLVDATLDLLAMGRPLVTSPRISPDNLAWLRDALQRAMENEDLAAESEETERPLNYLSGEEMDETVQRIQDAPESFRETLVAAY